MAAQPGPRFRILGERAAFTKHGLDGQEPALVAGGVPGTAGWGDEPGERWGRLGEEGALRGVRTEAGCYQRFHAGVVAALRSGAAVPVDPQEAIAALDVIEAARVSAERGQVERLEPAAR